MKYKSKRHTYEKFTESRNPMNVLRKFPVFFSLHNKPSNIFLEL